jgi:predicted nucleic acid-binding Zn ribbon protein
MYCDACGAAIQAGQSFCSKCGKPIVGTLVTKRPGRVQSHLHLLGILWMAFAAFDTVGAVVLYVIANTLFAQAERSAFLRPLLSVIAILLLAKAALGFIAGWGLLQREKWARVLALVMGFVLLFTNIPFGTALGVYTMWVLMSAESESEYDALSEARAA